MSCTSPKCMLVAKGRKAVFAADLYGEPPNSLVMYQGYPYKLVYVPCGWCIACRRERRMDYTVLQALEASLYDDVWFVTLTYDDALCQGVYSLDPTHLQQFNELMRKYAKYHHEVYRFFGTGEYGEKKGRPHYHLTVFCSARLLELEDDSDSIDARRVAFNRGRLCRLRPAQKDENGNDFWLSSVIASKWPYGNHRIYRANADTFQYVAGYVVKKLYGESAREQRLIDRQVNSYSCQSRPSIGWPWFKMYHDTLLQHDKINDVIINTTVSAYGCKEWRIPRIMWRWLEKLDPVRYKKLKLISSQLAEVPDYKDNKRKALYDQYRADSYETTNKHKEV